MSSTIHHHLTEHIAHLELCLVNKRGPKLPQPQEAHIGIPHQGRAVLVDVRRTRGDNSKAAARSHHTAVHEQERNKEEKRAFSGNRLSSTEHERGREGGGLVERGRQLCRVGFM